MSIAPRAQSNLLPRAAIGQLFSAHVEDTFSIFVQQPCAPHEATARFPVVYATDADEYFAGYAALAKQLQLRREVRPFILVGIGYGEPSLAALMRMRDFYDPSIRELFREKIEEYANRPEVARPEVLDSVFVDQGAESFQKFLEAELLPLIDATYPTVPEENVFCGYSSGGAFGLRLLLEPSRAFKSIMLGSPATTFGGVEFALQMLASNRQRRSGSGNRLYLSVGTEEEDGPGLADFHLLSGCEAFAAALHEGGDVELTFERLEGETHGTAWAAGFVRGVRQLIGPPDEVTP